MDLIFEKIMASDSEIYNVNLNGQNMGYVFEDKEKKLWAAICINSQFIEPGVWRDRESAAQHLAKKAGII